jgi:hypothetical protein
LLLGPNQFADRIRVAWLRRKCHHESHARTPAVVGRDRTADSAVAAQTARCGWTRRGRRSRHGQAHRASVGRVIRPPSRRAHGAPRPLSAA